MRGGEVAFSSVTTFFEELHHQVLIVRSALNRLDSTLADIRGVLQAEQFDDELEVAEEMLKRGHLRAAGAVAGVALESHLKQVATTHSVKLAKRDPSIGDWNDALKTSRILDVPEWRFIQHMGDLRNLCAHSKSRDPTKEEVEDLIRGTKKIVKSVA